MKALHIITFILVIIGALNWGLIGLFNINVVEILATGNRSLEMIVYVLVGASALYIVTTHVSDCKICKGK